MKPRQGAEPPWLAWMREQIVRGPDIETMREILRREGVSDEDFALGLDAVRPLHTCLVDGKVGVPPLIRRAPPKLRRLDVPTVELYAYDDFMSAKDCARLIALVNHHLTPSTLPNDVGDAEFRTSQTCALGELRSPVAREVDAKICKCIGIQPTYSEGIQVQRYDVGQQFKPHTDYFEPGSRNYFRFATLHGNRTWTFMVYLNDAGLEGGATRFTNVNFAVKPKAGMALLWNNLLEDGSPNFDTWHCGEPVTRGHKVIITKWFRLNGTGPPFYE
jgi:prolyl 4-hydroxylase